MNGLAGVGVTRSAASRSRHASPAAALRGVVVGAAVCLGLGSLGAAAAAVPVPLFEWGERAPAAPLVFGFPTGIAVDDATGDVFVVDRNYEVARRFDADGGYLGEWPCKGCLGVEVDPVRRIVYVGRVDNETVERWTPDGSFLGAFGGPGTGDGEFNDPRNLAVDVDTGEVYVFDAKNARIQVFDADGTFLRKWGSKGRDPGQFRGGTGPYSVAFDPLSRSVVATDPNGNVVQRFDPQGNLLDRWELPRSFGPGQTRWIRDVEIDVDGSVMFADSDNERIQVFTPDGALEAVWRGPHDPVSGPFHPRSLAVNRVTGERYVMAAYAHRVDRFGADDRWQLSWGTQEDFGATLNLPNAITVLPGSGDVVIVDNRNFLMKRFTMDGEFVAQWGTSARIQATTERGNAMAVAFDDAAIAADGASDTIFVASSFTFYADPGVRFVQRVDGAGRLVDTWLDAIPTNNKRTGIALDPAGGRVFVSEPQESRIGIYAYDGTPLGALADIDEPAGLAWGPGGLYAAVRSCQCIRRFDADGAARGEWGGPGSGEGQFALGAASGVALDADGRVFVVDTGNDRLQVFDGEGGFLFAFGTRGRALGEFREPAGAAIDPAADRLYVTDPGNARVQAFDLQRRGAGAAPAARPATHATPP